MTQGLIITPYINFIDPESGLTYQYPIFNDVFLCGQFSQYCSTNSTHHFNNYVNTLVLDLTECYNHILNHLENKDLSDYHSIHFRF